MTINGKPPFDETKVKAIGDLIIGAYEKIVALEEPRLEALQMQMLRPYALALRQRKQIASAVKARASEMVPQKGVKK